MTDRDRDVVVLCSPSLGILDNWLPVLHAARRDHPSWRIRAVIPATQTVMDVVEDDTVVRLADEILDEVVFRAADGRLLRARSLVEARRIAGSRPLLGVLTRGAAALERRAGGTVPGRVAARMVRAVAGLAAGRRRRRVPLATLRMPQTVLCYDVYVSDKPACRDVLTALAGTPRYSIHHGVNVVEPYPHPVRRPDRSPVVAYLYAAAEREAYRVNHGLDDGALRVVGVPRHEQAWMEHVIAASERRHDLAWDDAVFLISRPGGSSYLPDDRRRQALRDIHRVVCEENGLRLVVKPHPKEGHLRALASAFPSDTHGHTWTLSRAHPFHIGARSRFAVSFLSGVAIDLIPLGVPTVERLDVRGLPGHDGPDALRDERGRPAYSYFRRHGLVLPADDVDDLRAQVQRILADREQVVAQVQAAYAGVFAPPEGAIGRIVSDLADGS
jgi:hypothetical protein